MKITEIVNRFLFVSYNDFNTVRVKYHQARNHELSVASVEVIGSSSYWWLDLSPVGYVHEDE